MYQLNFPNGNVQTYNSLIELRDAARLLGGEAKLIGGNGKIFAFVIAKSFSLLLKSVNINITLNCFVDFFSGHFFKLFGRIFIYNFTVNSAFAKPCASDAVSFSKPFAIPSKNFERITI